MIKKESDVSAAIPLAPIKTESYSMKPLLLHPSPRLSPSYDLRVPVPPRQVRLLIGELPFYEHVSMI